MSLSISFHSMNRQPKRGVKLGRAAATDVLSWSKLLGYVCSAWKESPLAICEYHEPVRCLCWGRRMRFSHDFPLNQRQATLNAPSPSVVACLVFLPRCASDGAPWLPAEAAAQRSSSFLKMGTLSAGRPSPENLASTSISQACRVRQQALGSWYVRLRFRIVAAKAGWIFFFLDELISHRRATDPRVKLTLHISPANKFYSSSFKETKI